MEIKRDSRYYKIMKALFSPYSLPNNVCELFWTTVILFSLLAMAVSVLLTAVLVVLYSMLILPLEMWGVTNFGLLIVDEASAVLSMFLWVAAGLYTICIYRYSDYYPAKRENIDDDVDDDTPNIVIEYLKAKKQKLCPLIEYVD